MPLSLGIPFGLLLMIVGAVMVFVSKRRKILWAGLIVLGGLIALGAFGVILLAVNTM